MYLIYTLTALASPFVLLSFSLSLLLPAHRAYLECVASRLVSVKTHTRTHAHTETWAQSLPLPSCFTADPTSYNQNGMIHWQQTNTDHISLNVAPLTPRCPPAPPPHFPSIFKCLMSDVIVVTVQDTMETGSRWAQTTVTQMALMRWETRVTLTTTIGETTTTRTTVTLKRGPQPLLWLWNYSKSPKTTVTRQMTHLIGGTMTTRGPHRQSTTINI